jgi:hypothetical protein
MRFPVVRERVRVQGRDGTFVVLAVDRARGVANLTSATKGGKVEENVPLSSILPLASEASGHTKKEPSSN